MYQKINMTEENIGQEFRLKEIDEKRNHFIKETNQNKLKLKKHKKVCKILNYTKHLLILASKYTGCVSLSAFASLVGTPSVGRSCKFCCNNKSLYNYRKD